MTPHRAPAPGGTIQVPVPGGPTEQQATDAAVNYGWLIALVIIAVLVVRFLKFIVSSKPVQILAAIVFGVVLWQTFHGGI